MHGKRVVLFGSYAPSLITFRGPLIAELLARGHEVFALAPDFDERTSAALCALGATPVGITLSRTNLNPFDAAHASRQLKSQFADLRPDVVIAYTIKPIVLGGPAARAAGARFVPMITGMGYAFQGGIGPRGVATRGIATLLYRRALRHAAVVLFQNDDDRRDFRRYGMLPIGVPSSLIAGSGVDIAHFAARPVRNHAKFLMIARFLKAKGVREYAKAAAILKRDFPYASFHLAGWLDESPDSISALELAALTAAGIENLGRLDDVRNALADCSAYVLPSYREGTPRSVLEAMSIGRAIVTTDAPGCRETVVEGHNGFMVPVGDAQALAAAMRRLIEEPHLAKRMGERSRRMVEERFDVRKVNESILAHAGL